MDNRLDRPNLKEIDPSFSKVNSEKLGHIKGLLVRLVPFELWITWLCLAISDAPHEVLEGYVERLSSLLKRLGRGVFEKRVILFQFY